MAAGWERPSVSDPLSSSVIGAAVEVHRVLGPGLLESIYERCLERELQIRGFAVTRQQPVSVEYKGLTFEHDLRFDLLVDKRLLVELKCVEAILPIHKAQTLSYMRLLNCPMGLVLNFHGVRVTDGLARLDLPPTVS